MDWKERTLIMMAVITDLSWSQAPHDVIQRPNRAVHVRISTLHYFNASSFTVTLPFTCMSNWINLWNLLELLTYEMELCMPFIGLPYFTMMQYVFTWSPDAKGGLKSSLVLNKKKGSHPRQHINEHVNKQLPYRN